MDEEEDKYDLTEEDIKLAYKESLKWDPFDAMFYIDSDGVLQERD